MTNNIAGVEIAGLDNGGLEFGKTGIWQIPVHQIPPLPCCLSFSSPANSSQFGKFQSAKFQFCKFHPCNVVPDFLVLQIPVTVHTTASTVLGGSRIHKRTTLANDKLE